MDDPRRLVQSVAVVLGQVCTGNAERMERLAYVDQLYTKRPGADKVAFLKPKGVVHGSKESPHESIG